MMKISLHILIAIIFFIIPLASRSSDKEVAVEFIAATTQKSLSALLSPNSILENIDKSHLDVNKEVPILASKAKVFGMRESSLTDRSDIKSHGRADVTKRHKIVIAAKQSNLDLLEELVSEISDPDSDSFGKVKTRDEIATMTNHGEASEHILAYIRRHWRGSEDVAIERSVFGEYISGQSTCV